MNIASMEQFMHQIELKRAPVRGTDVRCSRCKCKIRQTMLEPYRGVTGYLCSPCHEATKPMDDELISMYDSKAVAALNAKLAAKPKKQIVKKNVYPPQPKCEGGGGRRMSKRQIEGLQILAVSEEPMSAKELGRFLGLKRANGGNVVLQSYRLRGFAGKYLTHPAATWEITEAGREWLRQFEAMKGE